MIVTNARDCGALLREARLSKNMTQAELAKILGVSRQWVISAEAGAPALRFELMLRALRIVDGLIDVVHDEDEDD
jgi:HTH-type transcriptional regulator/antitoxin HipB